MGDQQFAETTENPVQGLGTIYNISPAELQEIGDLFDLNYFSRFSTQEREQYRALICCLADLAHLLNDEMKRGINQEISFQEKLNQFSTFARIMDVTIDSDDLQGQVAIMLDLTASVARDEDVGRFLYQEYPNLAKFICIDVLGWMGPS
jgi:hypothetical protein